jgi:hypothetical protein
MHVALHRLSARAGVDARAESRGRALLRCPHGAGQSWCWPVRIAFASYCNSSTQSQCGQSRDHSLAKPGLSKGRSCTPERPRCWRAPVGSEAGMRNFSGSRSMHRSKQRFPSPMSSRRTRAIRRTEFYGMVVSWASGVARHKRSIRTPLLLERSGRQARKEKKRDQRVRRHPESCR